jgi:NAD(P)H-nitrite reductase large subunit
MRYLIIGNSAGGINAAKSIRKADKKGKIIILSDEGEFGYSRIAIPEIMKGKLERDKATFFSEDLYEEFDITLRPDSRVTAIDPKNNWVTLDDNRKILYDRLLIASGASPIFPHIRGIGKKGIYGVRTLKDMERIEEGLEHGKRVTILGGGLVGLKSAEALCELGCDVTIVELLDRLLPLRLDHICSELLEKEVGSKGIRMIFNSTIKEINGDKRIRSVLVNDEKIPTDVLIMAIGVRPNSDFLEGSGIEFRNGIVVNQYLETNIENIYAVGDAAIIREVFSETPQSIPIWPEASVQGRIAGLNMAGTRQEYHGGMVMNSIKVFGLPIVSFGHIEIDRYMSLHEMVRYLPEKRWYRRAVFEKDKLRGAIFVGDIKPAGIAQWLIRKEIEIPKEKRRLLLEEDFDFAKVMKNSCIKKMSEGTYENRPGEMYRM